MSETDDPGDTPAVNHAELSEVQALISEFEEVLDKENTLLQSADSDELQALASRKLHLLNSLGAMETQIVQAFQDDIHSKKTNNMKDALSRCQLMNRENQLIAQVVLNQTTSSIELLRSIQNMDDLRLYEASGEMNIKREKRRLGSA